MSKEQENKEIVGRWFTEFWGETCNLAVVDELAAPDMLLQYSLHAPRRGHDDIKRFMTDFHSGHVGDGIQLAGGALEGDAQSSRARFRGDNRGCGRSGQHHDES